MQIRFTSLAQIYRRLSLPSLVNRTTLPLRSQKPALFRPLSHKKMGNPVESKSHWWRRRWKNPDENKEAPSPAYGADLEKNLENTGAAEAELRFSKGLEAEIILLLQRICLHAIGTLDHPLSQTVARSARGSSLSLPRFGNSPKIEVGRATWKYIEARATLPLGPTAFPCS